MRIINVMYPSCFFRKLLFLMRERLNIYRIADSHIVAFSVINALHEKLFYGYLTTCVRSHGQVGDSKATLPESLLNSIFTILEHRSLL